MLDTKLSHLEAFRVLAEELHFGRAAERIGTSQPYLSQIIRDLEGKLKVSLFERRPVVRLTTAGESFLDSARRCLREIEFGTSRASRAAAGPFPVSLGVASTVLLGPIGRVLKEFSVSHSGRLKIRELHSASQVAAIRSGAIDLGLLRDVPDDTGLEWRPLLEEELVAVVPTGFSGDDVGRLPLAALSGQQFVVFRPEVSPGLHRRLVGACHDSGFSPEIAQEVEEWHTIVALVGLGFGVSIAPAGVSRLCMEGVEYLPLTGVRSRAILNIGWLSEAISPGAVKLRDLLLGAGVEGVVDRS